MTTKKKFMTLTYLHTDGTDPPSDLKNNIFIPFTYNELYICYIFYIDIIIYI